MNIQGDIGGGEVLDYIGNKNKLDSLLNESLINQYNMVPAALIVIALLILILMSYLILKTYRIKSPFKGRAISAEIRQLDKIRRRDASIVRANRLMNWSVKFISRTPFVISKSSKSYIQYNLNRAGIKIPGGSRLMDTEEFNAIIQGMILFLLLTLQ